MTNSLGCCLAIGARRFASVWAQMWAVELYAGSCAASPLTVQPEADGVELVPEQDHCMVTPCQQKPFEAQPRQRPRNILIKWTAGAEVAKQHHYHAAAIPCSHLLELPSLSPQAKSVCQSPTVPITPAQLTQGNVQGQVWSRSCCSGMGSWAEVASVCLRNPKQWNCSGAGVVCMCLRTKQASTGSGWEISKSCWGATGQSLWLWAWVQDAG